MRVGSAIVSRAPQALLMLSVGALSWLLAMAVHELGHVLGAWLTGGHVERVVLHPLAISRTDVRPNPQPLAVAWSGPIVGAALPLAMLAAVWRARGVTRDLVRFFAGVCLIGNGLYLGIGEIAGVGDAGDLLRHGASAWQLWIFGLLCVPLGLWLWNGIGPTFGFGGRQGRVSLGAALLCAGLALAAAGLEFAMAAD